MILMMCPIIKLSHCIIVSLHIVYVAPTDQLILLLIDDNNMAKGGGSRSQK